MYEEFNTLSEVNNRIKNRCFIDFKINNELSRNVSSMGNGSKKYILNTKALPEPYPVNNCKEFKTIQEVNSILSTNPTWYELHIKNTGTFILLWGTHREFTYTHDMVCGCELPH